MDAVIAKESVFTKHSLLDSWWCTSSGDIGSQRTL